jgi:hypothetical protein
MRRVDAAIALLEERRSDLGPPEVAAIAALLDDVDVRGGGTMSDAGASMSPVPATIRGTDLRVHTIDHLRRLNSGSTADRGRRSAGPHRPRSTPEPAGGSTR